MQCTLQYGRQNKRSDLLVHTRVTSPSFPFSLSFFLSFCLLLSLHPTPSHRKTLLTIGKHEIKQLIPPALKLCRRLIMITREPSMPPPRSSGHRSLPIYRSIDNRLRALWQRHSSCCCTNVCPSNSHSWRGGGGGGGREAVVEMKRMTRSKRVKEEKE